MHLSLKVSFPDQLTPKGGGEWVPHHLKVKACIRMMMSLVPIPQDLFGRDRYQRRGRRSSGEGSWNDAFKKSNFPTSSPADFGEKRPKLEKHSYHFAGFFLVIIVVNTQQLVGQVKRSGMMHPESLISNLEECWCIQKVSFPDLFSRTRPPIPRRLWKFHIE